MTIMTRLPEHRERLHKLTSDNGKGVSNHALIDKILDYQSYLAHQESGLNENTNGLIRQYFPKKTDFDQITQIEPSILMLHYGFNFFD